MKRVYGTGNIQKVGKNWHARYTNSLGIRVSVSTGTDDKQKATRFLQKKIGEVAAGINPDSKRNVGAMAKAYLAHLQVEKTAVDTSLPKPTQAWRARAQLKQYREQERNWNNHLEEYFASNKRVAKSQLDEYVLVRRGEKASGATIQRELSLLQKILNYSEAPNMPTFPRMKESAPREGFIKQEDFNRLRSAIPDAGLHALVGLAYKFSFRKDEILNLLVRQLDGPKLKLFKGTTKNSKPRDLILDDTTLRELEGLVAGKGPDDYIFTWQSGHARGKAIRDFRAAWDSACKAAGVKLHFHDLRRSAIRNMIRRGVNPQVAMKISGHLTQTVFNRYNITDEEDLIDAALKIEEGAAKAATTTASPVPVTNTNATQNKFGENLVKKAGKTSIQKVISNPEQQN